MSGSHPNSAMPRRAVAIAVTMLASCATPAPSAGCSRLPNEQHAVGIEQRPAAAARPSLVLCMAADCAPHTQKHLLQLTTEKSDRRVRAAEVRQ